MTDAVLSASDQRALVAALTAEVLADVAPEEMPAYEAEREVFLDGRLPTPAGGTEQHLGIGLEVAAMLTPAVVAAARAVVRVLAGALADSAVSETKAAATAWIRRALHGGRPASPEFSAQELARIRETAYAVCLRTQADDGDAGLIADAIVGRLMVEAGPGAGG